MIKFTTLLLFFVLIIQVKVFSQLPKIDWNTSFQKLEYVQKENIEWILGDKVIAYKDQLLNFQIEVIYSFRKSFITPNKTVIDNITFAFIKEQSNYQYEENLTDYKEIRDFLISHYGINNEQSENGIRSSIWKKGSLEIFHYLINEEQLSGFPIHKIEILNPNSE